MKLLKRMKRALAAAMTALLLIAVAASPSPARADSAMVMTLGADLSAEQKQAMLDFFNVEESDAMVITVTNADERRLLLGQYTEGQIGTKTYSCSLVRPTASGGIQVKTANLSVVTGSRIASILSTSGVTDCEVIAAAPFVVSGTGALTGVMMGYEQALDIELDPAMRDMAIEESITVSKIGETIGQDEATLLVNDIKINIIRSKFKDKSDIEQVVDDTVDAIEQQLDNRATVTGKAAPKKLGQAEHETLYAYGTKISAIDYDYDSMKITLQRVTENTAKEIGIDDPIVATFEDLSDEDVLSASSILHTTNDESMGNTVRFTATDNAALEDAPSLDEAVTTVSWNGTTYALFDLPKTWTEARQFCRALGGDLAAIHTAEEQEAVQSLAAESTKEYIWLGGQRDPETGSWSWTDGEKFALLNWAEGQPDGAAADENCLYMLNRKDAETGWIVESGIWSDGRTWTVRRPGVSSGSMGKWCDAPEAGDAENGAETFAFICALKD